MNKPLGPDERPEFEQGTELAATATAEDLAFQTFDAWMDTQLDELVKRWRHLAAPNAERHAGRRRNYF